MTPDTTSTPVNQKTIAEHLKVSIATVSKALGNKSDISEAMRLKVEKAASELGYKYGSANQKRKAGQSKSGNQFIGVFIRRPLENGGKNVPTYMDGMSRVAAQHGTSLVVQEWGYDDDPATLTSKRQQPPALRDGLLSGVALGGEWPVEIINNISLRYPVVLFPQSVIGSGVDVVGMDNVATMQQIIARLKRLGHERIGFLGRCGSMTWASERFAGYVSAIDRMGLPYNSAWALDVDEAPMLNEGHKDYWRGRVDRIEAARNDDGVEAWVCSSDWPAFQIYRGMADRGYEVPKDLSVTGFDDTEPVHLGCPPVTSVKVPRELIGEAALKRLLYLIENPRSEPRQSKFACRLMLNGTTGKPTYIKDTSDDRGGVAV